MDILAKAMKRYYQHVKRGGGGKDDGMVFRITEYVLNENNYNDDERKEIVRKLRDVHHTSFDLITRDSEKEMQDRIKIMRFQEYLLNLTNYNTDVQFILNGCIELMKHIHMIDENKFDTYFGKSKIDEFEFMKQIEEPEKRQFYVDEIMKHRSLICEGKYYIKEQSTTVAAPAAG
jgi:hypothetical protein